MGKGAVSDRPGVTDRERLAVARFALGVGVADGSSLDWDRVLQAAVDERCAPLAWLRSGAAIRATAPADVVARWRAHALAGHESAHHLLHTLQGVTALLAAHGIAPIVLKGLPLAAQLYGDFGARPTSDLDLYVPPHDREAAHDALVADGWRHIEGVAPAESTYQRSESGIWQSIELHSSVLDENMVAHLAAPTPEAMLMDLEGVAVLAQTGPLVPVFLAVHLAKHAGAPLLWWIDLATLWHKLGDAARREATELAKELRTDGYLDWAAEGIALVRRLADPDEDVALAALAGLRELHRGRAARRLGALAATLRDRVRIYLAWAWPHALRRHPVAYLRHALARIAAIVRPPRRHPPDRPGDASAERNVEVSRDDFVSLVRDAVGIGGFVWIRAKGGSMLPAIPRGAAVRLAPVSADEVVPGAVVLATLPSGQPVLHRVLRADGGRVFLKGDNVARPDAATTLDRVIAHATHVQIDGVDVPLGDRPRRSLRMALSQWRMRFRERGVHA